MWVILFCMLCTLHIANRPCHGFNFIDLPGFGSDEAIGQKGKQDSQESSSGESAFRAEDMLKSQEFDGHKRIDENHVEPRAPVNDRRAQLKAQRAVPEDQNRATDKVKNFEHQEEVSEYPPGQSPDPIYRRHWLVSAPTPYMSPFGNSNIKNDKDERLKSKIRTLVQQTVHDTEQKIKGLEKLKERHRGKAAYKVGFILSMIKKSRDVLNELFNVAIKHRDEWKSLEQLKIFELIVHTNVDTTDYVRQLIGIHIKHLNDTTPKNNPPVQEPVQKRV